MDRPKFSVERLGEGAPTGVSLIGILFIFTFFVTYTHTTGNLVAWAEPGIGVLKEAPLALFVYEASHTTHALVALFSGAWLVACYAVVQLLVGKLDRGPCFSVLNSVWLFGIVVFLVCHLILTSTVGSQIFLGYARLPFWAHPGREYFSPTNYGWFAAPAVVCAQHGRKPKGVQVPVYRMKRERTTRGQLRKGDRPWEGRLWESHQPMNKNHIVGRQDGKSWHNAAKSPRSVLEVNGAVGWRRFSFLPGEICPALRPALMAGSAQCGDAWSDRAEVSRGHSTREVSRGDERSPINNATRKPSSGKGRTNIGEPTCAPSRNSNRRRAL